MPRGTEYMVYKPHHLYINGKPADRRGLDLAVNPFSGKVVGEVELIVDKAFSQDKNDEDITQEVKPEIDFE